MLGQLETRLTGVVVAALKEAFDRDRARMDLERAQLKRNAGGPRRRFAPRSADRRPSGPSPRSGWSRIMALGIWMLSAVLGVWMPGMRAGAGRWLLGGAWALLVAALGSAFASWQRITTWGVSDAGSGEWSPSVGERMAPWLLVVAVALAGTALLVAL